jgi:hypothetical protein
MNIEVMSEEYKKDIEKQEQCFSKLQILVDKFSVEEDTPIEETFAISILKILEGVFEWPDFQSVKNLIYQFCHDSWPSENIYRVILTCEQKWNGFDNGFEWDIVDSVFTDLEDYSMNKLA